MEDPSILEQRPIEVLIFDYGRCLQCNTVIAAGPPVRVEFTQPDLHGGPMGNLSRHEKASLL